MHVLTGRKLEQPVSFLRKSILFKKRVEVYVFIIQLHVNAYNKIKETGSVGKCVYTNTCMRRATLTKLVPSNIVCRWALAFSSYIYHTLQAAKTQKHISYLHKLLTDMQIHHCYSHADW